MYKRIAIAGLLLLMIPSLTMFAQRTGTLGTANTNRTLTIQSGNVIPSELYIDNQQQKFGGFPFSVTLAAGQHSILAKAKGFQDFSIQIDLQKDQSIQLNFIAATVNLTVTANVKGALVFINNNQMGNAGSSFSLPIGTYQVKVSAPGYSDFVTNLQLNGNQNLNAVLNPASFNLAVSANVKGAQVFINNSLAGNAGSTFTLQPATYQIRVSADGYQDFSTSIQLSSNQSLNVTLNAALYNLTVNANVKGASVSINNQVGNAGSSFSLPAGTYQVKVSAPNYQDFVTSLQLAGNQTLNVTLNSVTYNLTVNGNVKGAAVFINNNQAGNVGGSFALQPGTYQIKVTAPGYQDFTTSLSLAGNQVLNVTLNQSAGTVVIETQKGVPVQITIDGQRQKGDSFMLQAGQHTVRFEHGQLVAETTINVVAGQTMTLTPVFSIMVK